MKGELMFKNINLSFKSASVTHLSRNRVFCICSQCPEKYRIFKCNRDLKLTQQNSLVALLLPMCQNIKGWPHLISALLRYTITTSQLILFEHQHHKDTYVNTSFVYFEPDIIFFVCYFSCHTRKLMSEFDLLTFITWNYVEHFFFYYLQESSSKTPSNLIILLIKEYLYVAFSHFILSSQHWDQLSVNKHYPSLLTCCGKPKTANSKTKSTITIECTTFMVDSQMQIPNWEKALHVRKWKKNKKIVNLLLRKIRTRCISDWYKPPNKHAMIDNKLMGRLHVLY